MAIVFMYLIQVKPKLRTYFFSHSFLKIFDLTRIFLIVVGALNKSASFHFSKLFLEIARTVALESRLFFE